MSAEEFDDRELERMLDRWTFSEEHTHRAESGDAYLEVPALELADAIRAVAVAYASAISRSVEERPIDADELKFASIAVRIVAMFAEDLAAGDLLVSERPRDLAVRWALRLPRHGEPCLVCRQAVDDNVLDLDDLVVPLEGEEDAP